jgi:hypothetical protein
MKKCLLKSLLLSAMVFAQADSHAQSQASIKTELTVGTGGTALMLASADGHAETVKLLLDRGVDFDQKDSNGRTALDWAREKGHLEIVNLIVTASSERIQKQLAGATLAQLLEKNNLDNEAFVTALTGALIRAKNSELPGFIAKATVEQRAALVSAVETRQAQAQTAIVEINSRAEDAVRNNQNAAEYRRQVGKLQAYIAVLADIKNILNQS